MRALALAGGCVVALLLYRYTRGLPAVPVFPTTPSTQVRARTTTQTPTHATQTHLAAVDPPPSPPRPRARAGLHPVTSDTSMAARARGRTQVVVEPSGAVGLAAVLSPAWAGCPRLAACRRVGIVLCGGNLDFGSKGFWEMWGT